MFKKGDFICQDHISFWNSTLILLNCYHVVLRSDFEIALEAKIKTCLDTCSEFDAEWVIKSAWPIFSFVDNNYIKRNFSKGLVSILYCEF